MTLLSVRNLVRLLNTLEPVNPLPNATGIAFDSRAVKPGDAFFALPGTTTHGITFASHALAAGAAFIVSDRPHERGLLVDDVRAALMTLGRAARDRLRAPVIGVTGSVGKTSTKAMLAAALQARYTPGNLNTHYALAQVLVAAALEDATPGYQPAPLVLELGIDRPGEMAELVELTRPDHALLTHVGPSHLSALGDVAGVAREKSLLLERTPGHLVVGAEAATFLAAATLRRSVVATAVDAARITEATGVAHERAPLAAPPLAHATASVTLGALGSRVAWNLTPHGSGSIDLPWPGLGMAQNALAAIAMAALLGVEPALAARRIAAARLEPGRLERVDLGARTLLDDSYNSNPASLTEALAVLHAYPVPRVAFLGDMRELGDLEREAHLAAGRATLDLDLVVAVGPAAATIVEANPAARHVADAAEACSLIELIPPGATVLVKGSRSIGMERVANELRRQAQHVDQPTALLPGGATR